MNRKHELDKWSEKYHKWLIEGQIAVTDADFANLSKELSDLYPNQIDGISIDTDGRWFQKFLSETESREQWNEFIDKFGPCPLLEWERKDYESSLLWNNPEAA